jgi:thiosulfate/3-mercaptopyruvate sulfurtransferase
MKRLLPLLAFCLVSAAPQAAEVIVDAAFVAEAVQRGAILWDVRSAEAYREGHIPGAVNIGHAGQVLRNPNTEDFIPTAEIERIWGAAGLDPGKEVVVYSSRGDPYAYFGYYAVRYFGGRRVHVFHDGIEGWRESGRPLARGEQRRAPVALRLVPDERVQASTQQVLASLRRPDVQILDVRTPAEFRGEDVRAIRGGHIPGAINIPYEQNWVDPDTQLKLALGRARDNSGMALKPREALARLYAGLDPRKETVVYCQSGVRAAQTAAVLESLGFENVRVYDSSWLGYAAVLSAPAENEVFVNVGALRGQLSALRARVEQLERELEALRRAR